jgi:hypothetical protein
MCMLSPYFGPEASLPAAQSLVRYELAAHHYGVVNRYPAAVFLLKLKFLPGNPSAKRISLR